MFQPSFTGFTGTPQSARPTNKASQIQICVWHLGVHVSGAHASSRWFGLAASQCPGSSASPTLALEISMDDGHHGQHRSYVLVVRWDVHAGMVFEEYFYHICSNIWQITDMTSREMSRAWNSDTQLWCRQDLRWLFLQGSLATVNLAHLLKRLLTANEYLLCSYVTFNDW